MTKENAMRMLQLLKNFNNDESGQDLLEYALVLAAVAAAAVLGSNTLAGTITSAIGKLNTIIGTSINNV